MNTTLKRITKAYPYHSLKFLYADSKIPESVVLPYDDFLGLMETLIIINDKKLLHSIKRGLKDAQENRLLTHAEVFD